MSDITPVQPVTSINNIDHFKREQTYKPLTPKEEHSFKDVLESVLEDSDRE